MALITYLARVKDQTGAKVAEFVGRGLSGATPGGMLSLSYYKRLRTPGEGVLTIGGLDARIDYLNLDNAGVVDSQIEFWRRDLLGGATYLDWIATLPTYQRSADMPGWYKDFEIFHRYHEFKQDSDGTDTFTARGRGYNDLLAAETVRYAAGSAYTRKTGAAETVIKEFVDENVGPSASSPPRARSGVMPGLTIEADAGTGAVWTGARANKNLLDVCQELAQFSPGDYMIHGTGAATFEFQWRNSYWGLDKRKANTAGNAPVIFSSEYGTATNIVYRYSRLDEVNICDVLGMGREADRRVETVTSGTETDSPWAARSVARQLNTEYDATNLQDKGQETLVAQRAERVFGFTALQTPGLRYGRDWDIGDLVTLVYRGLEVDQKIVGVRVSISGDGAETIQPELEDWNE